MQDTSFYDAYDAAVDFIWEKINELYKGKWRKTKKKIFDYVMNDLIAYIIADVSPKHSLLYQKLNEEGKEKFFDICTECKNIYFSTTFEESKNWKTCLLIIGEDHE